MGNVPNWIRDFLVPEYRDIKADNARLSQEVAGLSSQVHQIHRQNDLLLEVAIETLGFVRDNNWRVQKMSAAQDAFTAVVERLQDDFDKYTSVSAAAIQEQVAAAVKAQADSDDAAFTSATSKLSDLATKLENNQPITPPATAANTNPTPVASPVVADVPVPPAVSAAPAAGATAAPAPSSDPTQGPPTVVPVVPVQDPAAAATAATGSTDGSTAATGATAATGTTDGSTGSTAATGSTDGSTAATGTTGTTGATS